MKIEDLIPNIDPNPMPGPYWLFKILLLITFLLHLLAMNMLLGSAFIALLAKFKKNQPLYQQLFENIKHKLPNLLAATITLGVAALLFVQVLYGQFFSTSSILMGWLWFMVIVILILAYYGLYYTSFRSKNGKHTTMIYLFSVIVIIFIAFIFSNNLTLSVQPAHWSAKYFNSPAGFHFHLEEATLWPRFLHFWVGALAIGGLFVALIGYFKKKKDPQLASFLIQHGGRWFMFATMAQVVIGVWFLIALPKTQMMLFMGKHMVASVFLILSIIFTLLTIFMMSRKLKGSINQVPVISISMITLAILTMMVIMRDILRDSYLRPYFKVEQLPFQTQQSVLILFLILFLVGVLLWLWMIKKFPFQKETEHE